MTKDEALAMHLADWCEILAHTVDAYDAEAYRKAAFELRRLHTENERLKTTPPAQPAVPDAFGTREGEHPQYIQGWNDCRAETLKMRKP